MLRPCGEFKILFNEFKKQNIQLDYGLGWKKETFGRNF